MQDVKDTVPRLQQVLPHMRDQLLGLREGVTFEEARVRYSATVDRLAIQGVGRRTASRVSDKDAFWAPTAAVLLEAMRLGFVERQQVPSALRYVEAHRDRKYVLTALGQQIADMAQNDIAAFCDRLAAALYEAHPYFMALISLLQESPIACPELSESEVESAARQGLGTQHWAEYVAGKLTEHPMPGLKVDLPEIKATLVSIVRGRFGKGPESRPTRKALTQVINDAFAVAAFSARGLRIGAKEIDILKSWGSQLRVLDQSRYVPKFEGFNIIWLAADIQKGNPVAIHRRDLAGYEAQISSELIRAYQNQANSAETTLAKPYLPIFKVRAEAAFHCRVTRALVDMVIQRLSDGAIDAPFRVLLHLGTTPQPPSEPLYRRGGDRRYEITIQPKPN
jgi:hypothetical protein